VLAVSTRAAPRRLTAEEFLDAYHDDFAELVDGWVVELTPSFLEHSSVCRRIAGCVGDHVDQSGLGDVTDGQGGYVISRRPDTVRVPDVGFITADRARVADGRCFVEGAPDLAVEVVSPTDRLSDVQAKAREYLAAGSRLVWVVDPDERAVEVWRADGTSEWVRDGALSGEDVLPGFELPLSRIFVR